LEINNMTTTIIILSIALAVSIFVNWNQLRKQESLSEYVDDLESSNTKYYEFYNTLKTKIGEFNSQIRQIDRLGSFEADDETGFIFKEMQDMFDELNKGI
tara:strand:- start:103 stop:402 length:300 start_codon:yes stop_codon:yes gene_type:complete